MREKSAFYFSDSLFWFSGTMPYYCMTVLWRRRRSKVHSSLIFVLFFVMHRVIFFIPWELSTGVKIIIIITKQPLGLSRSDGKRLDGLSLVPWEAGKPLTWNVKVICPLANSHVAAAAHEAGSAAEETTTCKTAKYSNIQAHHIFQAVAVESLGPISASGHVFVLNSVASLLFSRATTEKSAFYFSDSPFWFSGRPTMPSYCMTVLWRRRKSKVHSSLIFVFFYCIA